MLYKKNQWQSAYKHAISVPFIWMVFIPLLILDVFIEIYHHVCFSLYGLELVLRDKYIKIDRHKLEYLDFTDKINCAYCGYANGLLRYAEEIAARTESYWCGVKHDRYPDFKEPEHHKNFAEFGNEEDFKDKYIGEDQEEYKKKYI